MGKDHQPFIDMAFISNLAVYLEASQAHMLGAYRRALGYTARWIKTESIRLAKQGVPVRKLDTLRRRMKNARTKAAGNATEGMRFWFGLNPIPVSELKGKITGRRGKRHARRDKKTGRFIKRRKAAISPGFDPAGTSLPDTTFDGGFVAKSVTGKRTIFVRGERTKSKRTGRMHKSWIREGAIDVQKPMEDDVISKIILEVPKRFMEEYERDLKFRVGVNLRVDGKGRRI